MFPRLFAARLPILAKRIYWAWTALYTALCATAWLWRCRAGTKSFNLNKALQVSRFDSPLISSRDVTRTRQHENNMAVRVDGVEKLCK